MLHESKWNRPLHFDSRNDAEGFPTTLASSPGIAAWKVEQPTDALTILPGCVFGQEWALDGPGAGSDPLEDHRDPLAHADAHGA